MVHGGIIFYICDEAVGRYVTGQGKIGAAADGQIHFYKPAYPGKAINAEVIERKTGKRLGTYMVELKSDDGTLIADALFTVSFKS